MTFSSELAALEGPALWQGFAALFWPTSERIIQDSKTPAPAPASPCNQE